MKLDTEAARSLSELGDEVGIESGKYPFAIVQDCGAHAGARQHVGEFHGNIAAPDQHSALRKRVEIKKLIAGGQMLFAWNSQRHRFRAGGDQNVVSLKIFASHLDL